MRLARALGLALVFGLVATAWSAWILIAADRALDERGLAILGIVGGGAVLGALIAALAAPFVRARFRAPVAAVLIGVVAFGAWTLACAALVIPVYAWGSFIAYQPAWSARPVRQIINAVTTGTGLGAIFLPQLMGLAAPGLALALGLLLGSRSTPRRSAATAPGPEERR